MNRPHERTVSWGALSARFPVARAVWAGSVLARGRFPDSGPSEQSNCANQWVAEGIVRCPKNLHAKILVDHVHVLDVDPAIFAENALR